MLSFDLLLPLSFTSFRRRHFFQGLYMKNKFSITVLAVSFIFFSCRSLPQISADLSAPELVQKAQEASEWNGWKTAQAYYQAILDRFPDDLENTCTAQYEIAFIYYKQKKYAQAEAEFNALLARYNDVDGDLLPQKFKVLCENELKIIAGKQQKKNAGKTPAQTGVDQG
jgi:tetratricopeptide (TPR) repeat protein